MIIGIGTDIVKVERIKRVVERTPNFLKGYTKQIRKGHVSF